MLLTNVQIGQTIVIEAIEGNEKIKKFLFSLGCHEGEKITLISKLSGNYVINIKDSRYAIEEKIAKFIVLEE